MKRLVFILLCLSSAIVQAKDITFSIATLNVDGLPPSLSALGITIDINPDGPGKERTPLLGEKLNASGWDIIGLNEDFNFHKELTTSMPAYNFQEHQGSFTATTMAALGILAGTYRFPIDGLGLATKKNIKVSNGHAVPWRNDAVYGYLTNLQDSLTKKGFRFYTLTLEQDASIDVIILHADAGYQYPDRRARENAFDQLFLYIKSVQTGNPMIVLGDYNSIYYRDKMQELYMDRLNAEPTLTAKDVWVEYRNNGTYPVCQNPGINDNDVSWDRLEEEKSETSEMIDKIVYINRSDATHQLQLVSTNNYMDFTDNDGKKLSDHDPIAATFILSDTSTGINQIATQKQDDKTYNLNGQRISGNYRGIVIQNGKAVVAR